MSEAFKIKPFKKVYPAVAKRTVVFTEARLEWVQDEAFDIGNVGEADEEAVRKGEVSAHILCLYLGDTVLDSLGGILLREYENNAETIEYYEREMLAANGLKLAD